MFLFTCDVPAFLLVIDIPVYSMFLIFLPKTQSTNIGLIERAQAYERCEIC